MIFVYIIIVICKLKYCYDDINVYLKFQTEFIHE